MVVELRVLYYNSYSEQVCCNLHCGLLCAISEPEYLGFPQDDVKVEVKPLITNGVSCLLTTKNSSRCCLEW